MIAEPHGQLLHIDELVVAGVTGFHGHAIVVVEMGVVRHVGGEPPDHVDAARSLEHLLVDLDKVLAVVVPSQPARVGSIKVDADVGQAQLLDSVGRRVDVHVTRFVACRKIQVSDQVGQGIWFQDHCDGQVGICLEVGRNGIDELGSVASGAILRNPEFPSRRLRSTVAVRHVVDHEHRQRGLATRLLLLPRLVEPLWKQSQFRNGIEPYSGGVLFHLANHVRVRGKRLGCLFDIRDVLGVEKEVDPKEGIAARALSPSWVSRGRRRRTGTLAQAGPAPRERQQG